MEGRNNLICKVCMCKITEVKQIFKFPTKPSRFKEVITTSASTQVQKFDDETEEMCSKCLSIQERDISIKIECDEMYFEETIILNLDNLGIYVKNERTETGTQPVSLRDIQCNSIKIEYDNVRLEDPLEISAKDANNDELTSLLEEESSCKIEVKLNSLHKKHKKLQEQFQCFVCNKQFQLKKHLIQHVIVHSTLKPFKCDICNKEFSRVSGLKAHQQTHANVREKSYKCDVCSKGFYNARALKQHKKTHIGGKTFKCDLCDSKFTQEFYLNMHKQIHFKCDVCCKDFYTSDVLKRHQKQC